MNKKTACLQITDNEGNFFKIPLAYNEDLVEQHEADCFTVSTDIFGLLDKDMLQKIFIEVIVQ